MKTERISTVLYRLQIISAITINLIQYQRMQTSTKGMLVSVYLLTIVYTLFSSALAWDAYRLTPSRATVQLIRLYGLYILLAALNCGVMLRNPDHHWVLQDTVTVGLFIAGTFSLALLRPLLRWTWQSVEMKAAMGINARTVPIILIGWCIVEQGGSGIAGATVLLAHLNIGLRIVQIVLTNLSSGWTPGGKGLLWIEGVNETTWFVVSVLWCVWG